MDTNKLKTYFWGVLDLVLAAFFINLVFFVMPTVQKLGDSFQPVRTISVSAEGKAFVIPDIAETSFSVVSRGQDPAQLADMNNKKITSAINFVKSQGIDAKDIKTAGYYLSPDYQYTPETQRSIITGYTLTQTVSVRIHDFSKIAAILGGLPPLGINQIGGLNFTVDEPEKFLAEARADAFKKARAKAISLVAQNGVRLGKVINIGESQGGGPMPYYAKSLDGRGGAAAPEIALPTIEPGQQELNLQVSVTYAIE
ncbi:MAG: SIMPL domain-containing protein [Patescibacteria group bacterium]